MNNPKWTWGAIGYLTAFAYAVSLIVYQFGLFFTGNGFTVGTAVGILFLAALLWLLFRKNPYEHHREERHIKSEAKANA